MIHIPDRNKMRSDKMRSTDRILVIKQMPGKKPTSGTGLVDPGLFTGTNQLHAIQDSLTTMWFLKYEHGVLPAVLRNKWTSFNSLLGYVKEYFRKRNLLITEVIE